MSRAGVRLYIYSILGPVFWKHPKFDHTYYYNLYICTGSDKAFFFLPKKSIAIAEAIMQTLRLYLDKCYYPPFPLGPLL